MASQIVLLPTMTQSSSAVDTSTGTVPAWDVSDAVALSIAFDGTSTAPGPRVQVAYTSESTATFFALTYNSSDGAGVILTSSGVATMLYPIAYKQVRVITTSIRTGTGLHYGNKQIRV